ncbi:restriction endonuclease [Streptomyces sp. NPDC020898]|uniref:restriction endonuclease n=1 Tax=Streptomyces sp. NPDC020898 TaxID=3365101 RepID=UPI0037B40F25
MGRAPPGADRPAGRSPARRTTAPPPRTAEAAGRDTFEHHIAELLRRDGCTNVVVQGGHGDRGVDIIALTSDGRRLVAQCKRFAPYLSITSPDLQRFVGSAKVLYSAEVALFVATCPFTPEALGIAAEAGITGEPLKVLE